MYHPRLYTPLTDILGCQLPILCAGMGGVARHRLAAAVSNAGGFGSLGMVRESPELIRAEVGLYRTLSDKPFAINLIPAATDPTLLANQIATCIALQVKHIVLFWDVNSEVIKRCRDNDIQIIHQVGSRQDAEQALKAGAEVLIVQGFEAGGHVRSKTTLFGLLPEIAALSPVPVVGSGGITHGKGLIAAMALGAQGVSCGTLFLASTESNAHDFHKQHIIAAQANDTVHSYEFHRNWPVPAPVRVLKNSVAKATQYIKTPNQIIGHQDGNAIYPFSTDSPLQGATGDLASMALYCGQGCGAIKNIRPAAAVINDFMFEADDYLNNF